LIKDVDKVVKPVIENLETLRKQKERSGNLMGFLKNAKAMKAEYLMAAEELVKMLP